MTMFMVVREFQFESVAGHKLGGRPSERTLLARPIDEEFGVSGRRT